MIQAIFALIAVAIATSVVGLAFVVVSNTVKSKLNRIVVPLKGDERLGKGKRSTSSSPEQSMLQFVGENYYLGHLAVTYLPQLGMLQTLALSFVYHWEEVTTATCEPLPTPINYLPSISACIGHSPLNRQVWGMWIGLYIGLRLPSIAVFWYSYAPSLWSVTTRKQSMDWLKAKSLCHLLEQIGLLGLTVVTSSEDLVFHQIYFVMYWIASICCLVVTTWINYQATKPGSFNGLSQERLRFTLNWRMLALGIHLAASASALFWYVAHETSCTNYFYTFFAMSEWTLVFSNVYFHVAETFEARDLVVSIQRRTMKEGASFDHDHHHEMEQRRIH